MTVGVGVIGAGYMGRGMIHQIMGWVPGMTVAALSNRTISRAELAFTDAGVPDQREAIETLRTWSMSLEVPAFREPAHHAPER